MKKKLIITLKSDLCVASGYSYAGIVDSDVCYDKYGLPYIPARRLKGCFRDTAVGELYSFITEEQVRELFGTRGATSCGALRISNAKIRNYDRIRNELMMLKGDVRIGHLFSQQRVLEQYTHIVTQTAIGEDCSAEDKSLRYTRVVNHYMSIYKNGEKKYTETVFEATIEYSGDKKVTNEKLSEDEKIELNNIKLLELIVGSTKNIGLKRNRGFGSVNCRLADIDDYSNQNQKNNSRTIVNDNCNYEPNEEYVISYTLNNDEPLILSHLSDMHSEKYINGQTILGYLAGEYLKSSETNSESEEFKDLFLNGTTKYVNAYPATINSKEKVCIYYPAPININILKKTKEYVDTLYQVPESKCFPGNQPKKLKGKFIYQDISDNTVNIDIKDVDMKIHYHHRNGEEGILYSTEAIEPYQIFAGEIYTKGKYVKTIVELINNRDFYFGKSKTAQYGHCECRISDIKTVDSTRIESVTGNVLVTCLTDAIICREGEYTIEADDIGKQLCKNIDGAVNCKEIMMATGLVSGYQTMWNMHKPLFPVIKAGSCFVLACKDGAKISRRFWIGKKNQEGYGYVSATALKEKEIKCFNTESKNCDIKTEIKEFGSQYCSILKNALLEELMTEQLSIDGITRTQISRAILMLKQCTDFADFKNRVNSIKTDSVKKLLINKLIKPMDDGNIANIGNLIKTESEAGKYYHMLTETGADLSDMWRSYLLYNLTLCKYSAKEA